MTGAYNIATREQVTATLGLLRHFRAFLNSRCTQMRDPFEIDMWRDGATRLDKDAAARKLRWLVLIAILRKAGWIEDIHSREHAPGLNHRGKFPRFREGDAQRHLNQIAYRLNAGVVVRERELGEWAPYLLARLGDRITRNGEE